MDLLFQPYDLAGLELKSRVVMAPMTRARAATGNPDELTEQYYRQRAGAGLIISEGAPISAEGCGYLFNPCLFTEAQAKGWRTVTHAVHAEGGRIFAQLWHVGRMSHTSLQPDGRPPVSSVAVQARRSPAFAYGPDGKPGPVQASEPRALETGEMARIVEDFVRGAQTAIASGFDGVEIHGANGYLFEQFINGALNTRKDAYGGSIENRLRLLLEATDAVAAEVGSSRVGVRLSPFGRLFDMQPFEDEAETWIEAARQLNERSLAYVHLSDQLTIGAERIPDGFAKKFRENYRGTLIAAGGFTRESAEAALQSGDLDLIAFGRPFIANPDLVERMKHGWPIAVAERSTWYGSSGAGGYTDFPAYEPENTPVAQEAV